LLDPRLLSIPIFYSDRDRPGVHQFKFSAMCCISHIQSAQASSGESLQGFDGTGAWIPELLPSETSHIMHVSPLLHQSL
jgi:hypothetical protein